MPSALSSLAPAEGERVSVIASVGAPGCGKEAALNHVFGTSFDEGLALPGGPSRPLCTASTATTTPGAIVLSTDVSYSGDAEARDRALAMEARLADVMMLHVWQADVGRNVPANAAALRALLAAHARGFRETSRRSLLALVVHHADLQVFLTPRPTTLVSP